MTSPQLVKWLKSHPLISVRGLEALIGVPDTTIWQAMKGGRDIPVKHIPAIMKALKKYGLKTTNP